MESRLDVCKKVLVSQGVITKVLSTLCDNVSLRPPPCGVLQVGSSFLNTPHFMVIYFHLFISQYFFEVDSQHESGSSSDTLGKDSNGNHLIVFQQHESLI